jgi:hypothetical protein
MPKIDRTIAFSEKRQFFRQKREVKMAQNRGHNVDHWNQFPYLSTRNFTKKLGKRNFFKWCTLIYLF